MTEALSDHELDTMRNAANRGDAEWSLEDAIALIGEVTRLRADLDAARRELEEARLGREQGVLRIIELEKERDAAIREREVASNDWARAVRERDAAQARSLSVEVLQDVRRSLEWSSLHRGHASASMEHVARRLLPIIDAALEKARKAEKGAT